MTPTKGDTVLYTFSRNVGESGQGQTDTVPAIVVEVWSETCVNLRVFQDGDDVPLWKTSVVRKDEAHVDSDYWEWRNVT